MKSPFRTILYLGSNSTFSYSRYRANALQRLGCQVFVVDPASLIGPRTHLQSFVDYRTSFRLLQIGLLRSLKKHMAFQGFSPELVWIDSGEHYGTRLLRWLRDRFHCPIILYNHDDPTGRRDFLRFHNLISALPYFSLCVFVRQETALEALALGARRVLVVHRSYDELAHFCDQSPSQHLPHHVVSFLGTMISGEHRDRFLSALIQLGLPLRIYGNNWQRSTFWPVLRAIYRGAELKGEAYAVALANSAVTLGMLSHQNRDLVTTRSFDTTACGGLLCAERTSEHQLLYEDCDEAVFWRSTEECYLQCNKLLNDPDLRDRICANGHSQVLSAGVGNEDICKQILALI